MYTDQNTVFITIAVFFILLIICIALLRYSSSDCEVWFSKYSLPKQTSGSDFSEDVLIQDYDSKKHIIGYYDFKEEIWRCINYQEIPNNFKWKYLNIDID